jgi:iron complex outermembrane receptor protein
MTRLTAALLLFFALWIFPSQRAVAGPVCVRTTAPVPSVDSIQPPLNRMVSLHVTEVSLREALDRLAASARLRLIYTTETLPLDRSVCVAADSVPVSVVLAALLDGIPAKPFATGPDQVVLAPVQLSFAMPPIMLDRIVVTGSGVGGAQKPLSLALTTIDGRRLARSSVGTLAEAMNDGVPGVFMWTQSPSSFLAQYGSVRGSSSFGLSYPKVYIDGIEVANPLLITEIAPEAVERIETIRGPQGAALYGADAISGVTNIILRQGGADGGRRLLLRTGLRVAESRFTSGNALEHAHGLDLRGGRNTRSGGLDVEVATTGAFVPNAYARRVIASSTGRIVGSRAVLTGTLRYFDGDAATPASPLLAEALQTAATTNTAIGVTPGVETMEQHTVGMNLKVQTADWFTQSLVAGVDGYRLDGVPNDRLPVPSAADAALVAARGGANRGTFRLSNVARFGSPRSVSGEFTVLAEHSPLHEWAAATALPASATAAQKEAAARAAAAAGQFLSWRSNSGLGGQFNGSVAERLFVTGGWRIERATNVDGVSHLPMLGATLVPAQGPVTLKFRTAYGKGIRWPQTTVRATLGEGLRPGSDTISTLAPEEQSGIEAGMDFLVGETLTLQITRFDQIASGLIQRVGIPYDTVVNNQVKRLITYQLQNVGEIGNHGWELQATVRRGPLSLIGTFSTVDSRVNKVARTYTGDLRAGDRMLEVPATTLSGSVAWLARSWSATVTAYRAEDWVYYDRLNIAKAYAAGANGGNFTGANLRRYWMGYPGVTHLRATLTRDLWWRVAVLIAGDNLLNLQTGEPDNLAVLPGRTLTLSLRGEF